MGRSAPEPAGRLEILAASTEARRASSVAQAHELAARLDWAAFEDELRRRRLLSLLGERIVELAGERAPASFRAALHAELEAGSRRDAFLELVLIQMVNALRSDGIRSLPLKGPTLGRALYGAPGRRPTVDLDILVALEDLQRAVAVARELGYELVPQPAAPPGLPALHANLQRPGLPELELHWRVHWVETRFSEDVLRRSCEDGRHLRRADPLDELGCALLFYARDGFVDLKLACDLAAWWDAHGSTLRPGALEPLISAYPLLRRSLLGALAAARRVVGLPTERLLHRPHPLDLSTRAAIALRNPHGLGTSTQRAAETHLVDLLLAPPGGHGAALRRHLYRWTHAAPSSGLVGGARSAYHALGLAGRELLALFHVIVNPRHRRRRRAGERVA